MNSMRSMSLPDLLVKCAVVMLVACAMFNSTLMQSYKLQMIVALFSFAIFVYAAAQNHDSIKINVPLFLWILFFLYVLIDQNRAFDNCLTETKCQNWIVVFGAVLFSSWIIGNRKKGDWIKVFFASVALFGLFHAIITVIGWMIPDFHSFISNAFFCGEYESRTYKSGFAGHYSTNGNYLAIGMISAFVMLIKDKSKRTFWLAAFAIVLFALLLTTKRAQFVFGILSVVSFYVFYYFDKGFSKISKLALFLLIGVTVFFLASLIVPDLLGVFARISDAFNDSTFGGRSFYHALCLEMWGSSELFGHGLGSYAIYFHDTALGLDYINRGLPIMYAHSPYYQVLAEQGIFGWMIFVGAIAASLFRACRMLLFKSPNMNLSSSHRAYLAGSVAMQLFFVLYGITGDSLYDITIFIPYLLSCAMAFFVEQDSKEGKISPLKRACIIS